MAVAGWILDKSAAARAGDPAIAGQLTELAGSLCVCPVGEPEQLYSARSAMHYDELKSQLHNTSGPSSALPKSWIAPSRSNRISPIITACGIARRSPTC